MHRRSGAFLFLKLQLGTCGDQGLACVVAGVLHEVLHEAAGQILSLGLPLSNICVGVAGIQDGGVDAGQSGGNLQIEQGDLLGLSLQDGAIRMASMMPRVSLMEMRLPVPFQPVLTR